MLLRLHAAPSSKTKQNKLKTDIQAAPVKCAVEAATDVACGADYTLWLVGEQGRVWAAGSPQYGQLGDGSDHMYNAKESSIQIKFEPQPQPRCIAALSGHKIVAVASGGTHAIAVSDAGAAFTWGNGNYGKLGHRVQQDELAPRQLEAFSKRILALPDGVAAAGSTSTFCVGTGPQLYAWGKLKTSGDNTTHPQPLHDLSGWNVSGATGGGEQGRALEEGAVAGRMRGGG